VFNAHQKILTYIEEHHLKSMGSTLSMTILFPNSELYIAHVGDSRIYERERQGELRQLSEDHSYPEVLFRLGKISEQEKGNYQKNIVVYILGKDSLKKEEICIYKSYLYSDTELLLCSDGFWDMIPIKKETFSQSFEALKEDIFKQISKDNVTVIRYKQKKNLKDISKESKHGKY
jgi:protein phosphatase